MRMGQLAGKVAVHGYGFTRLFTDYSSCRITRRILFSLLFSQLTPGILSDIWHFIHLRMAICRLPSASTSITNASPLQRQQLKLEGTARVINYNTYGDKSCGNSLKLWITLILYFFGWMFIIACTLNVWKDIEPNIYGAINIEVAIFIHIRSVLTY